MVRRGWSPHNSIIFPSITLDYYDNISLRQTAVRPPKVSFLPINGAPRRITLIDVATPRTGPRPGPGWVLGTETRPEVGMGSPTLPHAPDGRYPRVRQISTSTMIRVLFVFFFSFVKLSFFIYFF